MEFYISPQSGRFYMINVLENQWSVTYNGLINHMTETVCFVCLAVGGSRVAADGDSSCADSREQPNAAQSAENAEQPATGGPASSHSASSSPCE